MIEVILLIFLTKKIGVLALQKGLKPGTWKLYTVLAWIGAELIGFTAGMLLFGREEMIPVCLLGLGCAATSYSIILSWLNKQPDPVEHDMNRVTVNDLRP